MSSILIIGASKGIGRETVKAALKAGHTVTAFARSPEILTPHKNLRLFKGNVLDESNVMKAMRHQDAVICTLGLPTLKAIGLPFSKRSYVLSHGTANIIRAMEANGLKRLLCITAVGTGDSLNQCTWPARLTLRYGLRWLFIEKNRQEELIKNSNLEWTIIRPTALTKGKKQGVQTSIQKKLGLLTQVSRADVADTLVKSITNKSAVEKALLISYPPRFGDSLRWLAGYFGLEG